MGKVHHRRLRPKDLRAVEQALWDALASFSTREEIERFLRKLLTRSERVMLGRRIQIARMILSDKTFEDIKRDLRVGESTIASVYEWLEEDVERYREKFAA